MIRLQLLFVLLAFSLCTELKAQLYHKAYGDQNNPAIVFLHGGPGYNSFTFEASTAERLAGEGYYVVVFDQRGCGRSEAPEDSKYTFEEAVSDVDIVYKLNGIEKATLIGHSWGGALGLMYAEKYPGKVANLILVGAPMDYPETFKAIINNAREAYTKQGKETQIRFIDMLETFDPESLQYANYAFMQAMSAGLYSTDNPAENAAAIKERMKASPDIKLASNMTIPPVSGLYKSEHYTTLVMYKRLGAIKNKIDVYGIYGEDDGLFNTKQLDDVKTVVGEDNFTIVTGASHSVFIDQQDRFIALVNKCIKD